MDQSNWHVLSLIDAASETATCAICGPETSVKFKPHRSQWVCKAVIHAANRRYRMKRKAAGLKDPPRPNHAEELRVWRLKSQFGLSAADYDRMLAAQGGVCAVCGGDQIAGRRLAVDHDHRSGQVRGLLCHRCNAGIGLLGDDAVSVARALAYLELQPAHK